jgi:hypothetical protein
MRQHTEDDQTQKERKKERKGRDRAEALAFLLQLKSRVKTWLGAFSMPATITPLLGPMKKVSKARPDKIREEGRRRGEEKEKGEGEKRESISKQIQRRTQRERRGGERANGPRIGGTVTFQGWVAGWPFRAEELSQT